MNRRIAVVGAVSSLGIGPYEDGDPRDLWRTPAVLRQRGLVERLGAEDLGDVVAPPYADYVRPPRRPRNERQLIVYSRSLGRRVASATSAGEFALVIGGDCSIVLGCLLGLKRKDADSLGLAYVDAHADFATVDESRTGGAATMSLALASGRADTPLARLAGRKPLVEGRHVVLAGRRGGPGGSDGHSALTLSPILELPDAQLQSQGFSVVGELAASQVGAADVQGFWIHVDADVLNPAVMFAVDSPRPGGPMPDELIEFLTPIVHHPRALGMSISVYDPAFDPDRSCARLLIGMLETLFARVGLVDCSGRC